MFKKTLLAFIFMSFAGFGTNSAMAVPVDLELQLLVDVSGSISDQEAALQLVGYGNAFKSAAVQNAIMGGALGTIAVQLIQWSGAAQQSISINWTQLTTVAEMNAFGDAIAAVGRAYSGLTAPGSAINFGAALFANGFEGGKNIMDISGDGIQNDGVDTNTAANNAITGGIYSINGITIGVSAALDAWYQANIVKGTNAFLSNAVDFDAFGAAIQLKLEREITGVPAPGALGLLGFGLIGLALIHRRKFTA